MLALIDGDLIAYINAASAENDGADIAKLRADTHIRNILEATEADEYRVFISGGQNFRYEVNPYYKANRTQPKPVFLQDVNEFLVTEWKAEVTDGIEADDALGINQTKDLDRYKETEEWYENPEEDTDFLNTIICSIDKDMDMIPGLHYSWPIIRKGEVVREGKIYQTSELEGLKHFYKQMLIGDTADNIIGVQGIGKVKAAGLIDPLVDEEEMFYTVYNLYDNDDRFWMNADCLWIMRKENEKFSDRKINESTIKVWSDNE